MSFPDSSESEAQGKVTAAAMLLHEAGTLLLRSGLGGPWKAWAADLHAHRSALHAIADTISRNRKGLPLHETPDRHR